MDGASVADLTEAKAILAANAPEILGIRSTNQWYRYASGDSLAGNDEWIVRLTDNSGNYYPMGTISGTTTPSGASTKPVTYHNTANKIIYRNAGSGSTVWDPYGPAGGTLLLDAFLSANTFLSGVQDQFPFDGESTSTSEWNSTTFTYTAGANYGLCLFLAGLRVDGSNRSVYTIYRNGVTADAVVSCDIPSGGGGAATMGPASKFVQVNNGDTFNFRSVLTDTYRGSATNSNSFWQIYNLG